MAGEIATWANNPDQGEIWNARPVRGEVGIIVVPESQIQVYLLEGNSNHYYRSIAGAYQGFLFNNIQADFVHPDDVAGCHYELLYLPHPMMLPERVASSLVKYVEKGGPLCRKHARPILVTMAGPGRTNPITDWTSSSGPWRKGFSLPLYYWKG